MSSRESAGENRPWCCSHPGGFGFLKAAVKLGGALPGKAPGGGRGLKAPAEEKAASARERWLGSWPPADTLAGRLYVEFPGLYGRLLAMAAVLFPCVQGQTGEEGRDFHAAPPSDEPRTSTRNKKRSPE
jgi:hypothetical protein